MQNTRHRIMAYLEKNHQASAKELSQVLYMTIANIRHHLSVLENEGEVEIIGEKPASGRGRPTKLYMPTNKAQSNTLNILVNALLNEIGSSRSKRQRDNKLKRIAKRLAGHSPNDPQSLTIRLGIGMQHLNELSYRAHWEAHAIAPQMIFGKCPYSAIIDEHPELCQMDEFLLEYLLGEPVKQTTKSTREPDGPKDCRFVLKSSEREKN